MDKSDKRFQVSFYPRNNKIHPQAFTPDYKSSLLRSPKKAPISFKNTISEISR